MRKILRTFLVGLLGTYHPTESAKRAAATAFLYAETVRRLRERGEQTTPLFTNRISREEFDSLLP